MSKSMSVELDQVCWLDCQVHQSSLLFACPPSVSSLPQYKLVIVYVCINTFSCVQVCGQKCWRSLVSWQWSLTVWSLESHQTLFRASSIITTMAPVLMEAHTHSQSCFYWQKHMIIHQKSVLCLGVCSLSSFLNSSGKISLSCACMGWVFMSAES